MKTIDLLSLVALGAIWGASFIFMKIVSPVWGAPLTACLRVLFAGLVLLFYFKFLRTKKLVLNFKANTIPYFVIAAINTALPFCLYSFAANHIPASYSVLLNATAPVFGAIFSALWLRESLSVDKVLGILMGIIGVGLVVQVRPPDADSLFMMSLIGCLVAASCYAFAGIYIKKYASQVPPLGMAIVGQLLAALLLLPAVLIDLFYLNMRSLPAMIESFGQMRVVGAFLGLSLLCSGVAYLLYYRLLANVGPTKALTVTFLMPLFGILWSNIFLGEQFTLVMVAGALLIIIGTIFVLKQPIQAWIRVRSTNTGP